MNIWDAMEQELRAACPVMELSRNESMSKYTSFRVGGPVPLIARPKSLGNVKTVMKTAAKYGIIPFFLGNGSNLLVADEGANVFIVKPKSGWGSMTLEEGTITAWGSKSLPIVAAIACEAGYTGMEFAQGIPGSLGGAITMNAGAYGGDMGKVVKSVTVVDLAGTVQEVSSKDCGFGYRRSAFSDGKSLIWKVQLNLARGDKEAIKARMADFAAQRKAKQPLEYPSAGSTFKRPAPLPDGTPVYAAALIDQCGCKGLTVGGAQVSEKHAGFIINKGGAACADILALIHEVQKRVYDQTGIMLELEVKTLGV